MMENNTGVTYKVLWVEDKDELVPGIKIIAKKNYHIKLEWYDNWDDAEKALRKDFHSYSAIILDAFCRIRKADDALKDTFLSYAKGRIDVICGENRSEKPWYVFSEGTMSDFNRTTTNIREGRNSEWGEMLFIKTDEGSRDRLFQTIVDVAGKQPNNVVLFRHRDVFAYLGNERLIDDRARKIMLKVLSALYYPEKNIGFEYQGNPLRKVLEYIFRSARKQGLLSPYCFDKEDHVNLTYSSLYLKGGTVNLNGKEHDVEGTIRWGNENDCVFPDNVANIVRGILVYANVDSHTYEIDDGPFKVDESSKDLFFGYVLQLCYVIKWYGEFVKEHPDVKKNQCMQVENVSARILRKSKEKYEGARMIVELDSRGHYHCGDCSIYKGVAERFLGSLVELYGVKEEEYYGYPYSAKIRAVE